MTLLTSCVAINADVCQEDSDCEACSRCINGACELVEERLNACGRCGPATSCDGGADRDTGHQDDAAVDGGTPDRTGSDSSITADDAAVDSGTPDRSGLDSSIAADAWSALPDSGETWDIIRSDAGFADGTTIDAGQGDAATLDAAAPDAAADDAGQGDAAILDAAPDAAADDDAGQGDAAILDAAAPDGAAYDDAAADDDAVAYDDAAYHDSTMSDVGEHDSTGCGTERRFCAGSCTPCPTTQVVETGCDGAQCVALSCTPGFFPCAAGCCGWTVRAVDTVDMKGSSSSLVIDGQGVPHVSYYDQTRGDLRYAHDPVDGPWSVQVVDDVGWVGDGSSLALDGLGQRHISYYNSGNATLRYARSNATGWLWDVETVFSGIQSGIAGTSTSLALDENGHPYIAFLNASNHVQLATLDGQSWAMEEIDSDGDFYCVRIALDVANRPHLVYIDASPDWDLRYTYWSGDAWVYLTPDPSTMVSGHASLFLDSAGRPHISYFASHSEDLKYAYLDDNDWRIEVIDDEGDVGKTSSIALDLSGKPHVAYRDWTNGYLKHAVRHATGWRKSTVDTSADVGHAPSLAMDADGKPHITYQDRTYLDLKYARW